MTLYPTGYGRTLVELDDLFRIHHVDKMHPEYARRLRRWLVHMDGEVGIGGSWRPHGGQPDKPGFAPEGKSFHQSQRFASGLLAFCAVDLVRRDGPDPGDNHDGMPWHLAPVQGSTEAARWGVHINVGVPGNGESWHMQPVEIDGFDNWVARGRPEPAAGYPIPAYPTDTPEPPTMHPKRYILKPPPDAPAGLPWFLVDDVHVTYLRGIDRERERAAGTPELHDLPDRYIHTHRQVFAGATPIGVNP